MTPERWRRIKRLFHHAVERPPGERDAYLAGANVDDGTRREVASLLADDDAGSELLERPLAGRPRALLDDDDGLAGRRLGAYRLIRTIGEGGMSTVYLAVRADDSYRQRVAIKVIRDELDDADGRRRFHQERQILASLEHPRIARLIDGGTTADGRPYLVMEHVEGLPIDRYCARHRLPVAARLELFARVARAVGYAHRNLVVHRDLKPANVLVTAGGEPKLLDFGIAKLLNPTLAGESVSTLPALPRMSTGYASPEQVRGEPITTASDVYALGVMLYELLTGRRPLRLAGLAPAELVRAICEREPPAPSVAVLEPGDERARRRRARIGSGRPETLRRRLAGDLDAIVQKALAKEPGGRYGTVEELVADVERHLDHRPVRARPPTPAYRLVKRLRRNPLTAVLVTLIALAALAAAVQSVRLGGALELARAREAEALHERERSEEITALLADLFEVADPGSTPDAITARELLERGVLRAERELAGAPRIRAALYDAIGRGFRGLGLYDRAGEQLERALVLRRIHLGDRHPEVAESLAHLAFLRHLEGEHRVAETLAREALERRRARFGDDHSVVADSLHELAEMLHFQGRWDEAEPLYLEALAIRRARLGADDPAVAESLAELGLLRYEQGELDQAESLLREALAIWRERLGPEHPKVAAALGYLGATLRERGELEKAESHLRQALALQERILGERHPDVASTLVDLGNLYLVRGESERAEPLLRRALTLEERRGDAHPMLGTVVNDLARVLQARGELESAEKLLRRALAIYRATLGEEHPAVPVALTNLARLLRERGEDAAAEARYREALELRRRIADTPPRMLAFSLYELGRLYNEQGTPERAEPLLAESLELLRANGDELWAAVVVGELGAGHLVRDRPDDAEPLLAASHAVLAAAGDGWTSRAETVRTRLAEARRARGER